MELIGTVESIIFRNEENGYTVLEIKESESKQLKTAVGSVAFVNEGERVRIEGEAMIHPHYGEQIKIKLYESIGHSSLAGIERYLGSGLIKGLGPSTAKRIVDRFGLEALNIVQYYPHRLTEISGIGEKKAEQISAAFEEQREIRDVMVFLQTYDISVTYAIKIYRRYGQAAVPIIKENPYCLASDIDGIGFMTADRIARSMGVDQCSPNRISSAIKYVLAQAVGRGHTYLPEDELVEQTAELLKIDMVLITNELRRMLIGHSLQTDTIDGRAAIYLPVYYYAEMHICARLLELSFAECPQIFDNIEDKITSYEAERNIELAKEQKEAVAAAVNRGVMIITGGPGTGKTTIINCILEIFESARLEVLLTAPTGRAAKRMSETTGHEAKTIHRLLEYEYSEAGDSFARNEDYPLEADVLIVDEASMIDMLLMNYLLKAVAKGTRLIIVGDVDQLPSVGAGNVLRDIIHTEIIPVVRLHEIFRQAAQSMIVVNAHRINRGELPQVNGEGSDFFYERQYELEGILEALINLVCKRLPQFLECDPLKDIQVLAPMRKSGVGVNVLNTELQHMLNPPHPDKQEKQFRDTTFREGDKVMQIKNNYKIEWTRYDRFGALVEKGEGVFNGDVGYIDAIDGENQTMTVIFDEDKVVEYDGIHFDELELAYAISVHKSQGSEFGVVVMPMAWGPPMLMTRNLLYTAITRAKRMVVLVGREKTLQSMVENNHIEKRYSGLERRFQNILALNAGAI